jgi:Family of unknown function (DUF6356)
MDLKRLFTEHPDAVGESYREHMRVALSFAGPLALGAMAAFVHAFVPFLFVSTASATVRRLHCALDEPRAEGAARTPDRVAAKRDAPVGPGDLKPSTGMASGSQTPPRDDFTRR